MEKRRTITYIRYLLSAALTAGLFLLAGCGQSEESAVILRVANSEEYIDEGGWDEEERIELEDGTSIIGTNSMIDDFEQWYKETYGVEVRVEYSAYGTNEELYNQMSLGNTFDVVCPSEYMIMKLMGEGRLQPFSDDFFDRSDKRNYYIRGLSPYIDDIFHQLKQGDQELSRYGAGYMWGVMGIVYNPQKVSREAVKHWDMLLDPAYHKQITMKDSVRDSYFVGLGILHEKELLDPALVQSSGSSDTISRWLNDTGQETVDKVEEILSDMRENAYSLETDSGKADLVTGRVVANMQWSGDAVYSLDQAEEDGVRLAYSVPEECSNLWFDGWCMMINFLSRPDNVIRNMYYVGYTSVIAGGDSDLVYQYAEYCYGAEEDGEDTAEYPMSYFFGDEGDHILVTDREQLERQLYAQYPPEEVLRRSAVMNCFSEEANRRISQMWINNRCFNWM